MSIENDPGFWKQISGWMWAVLALPIATLWKKADAAVPKDEFMKYMEESREDRKETRQTMAKLFDKIDDLKSDSHDRTVRLMEAIERKADK